MPDATVTAQLRDHLSKIRHPVELVASLDGSPRSAEVSQLLGEIAALSDAITVVAADPSGAGVRCPSLAMRRALADVADLHFETYLSLSCQNCPEVVPAPNLMAALNPRITHVAIDGAVFPDQVEAAGVMAVPGEHEHRYRGVTFCPHCDGPPSKGKRVAVIGGGKSGVEAATDLAGVVGHVTLIEFDPELRADEVLQRTLHDLANVDVVVSALTTEVLGDGRRVTGLVYEDAFDHLIGNPAPAEPAAPVDAAAA